MSVRPSRKQAKLKPASTAAEMSAVQATFNYRRPLPELAALLKERPVEAGEEPLSLAALQSGTQEERERVFAALRESGAFCPGPPGALKRP
jgi:hypothetical protein